MFIILRTKVPQVSVPWSIERYIIYVFVVRIFLHADPVKRLQSLKIAKTRKLKAAL